MGNGAAVLVWPCGGQWRCPALRRRNFENHWGIIGGFIEEVENPNDDRREKIIGETFIKVKKSYNYKFDGTIPGEWFVDKKYPVEIIIDPEDSRKITLSWREGYSG